MPPGIFVLITFVLTFASVLLQALDYQRFGGKGDSKAEALSVLQAGKRRDTKGEAGVSRRLSELWSDGAEAGGSRSGVIGVERERGAMKLLFLTGAALVRVYLRPFGINFISAGSGRT
jgi:hypothetical protein